MHVLQRIKYTILKKENNALEIRTYMKDRPLYGIKQVDLFMRPMITIYRVTCGVSAHPHAEFQF